MNLRVCFDDEEFRFRVSPTGKVESIEPATVKPVFFSDSVTEVPIIRLFTYRKDFIVVISLGNLFWIFNGRYFRTKEGSPFRKISSLRGSGSLYCVSNGSVSGLVEGDEVFRNPDFEKQIAEELCRDFGFDSTSWFEYIFGKDEELDKNHRSWWFTKRLDILVREVERLAPSDIYVYFTNVQGGLPDMLLREDPVFLVETGEDPFRFVTHIPIDKLTWREFLHRLRALEIWVGESWDSPLQASDSFSFWKLACELADIVRYY